MKYLGGGGNPGAGSAMVRSVDTRAVEAWLPTIVRESHRPSARVRDLMSAPVLTISSGTSMSKAAEILWGKGFKGAPVVEADRLVGILSRRDFQRIRKEQQMLSPVKAFMSSDVVTVHPEESPGHAIHLMITHDLGHLPVLEDGKIVGIFSRSDAVKDLYGLCLPGDSLATGCEDGAFPP